jgi:hypothetical protein
MAIDLRCLFDFRHFKDAKIMVDVRPVSNEGTLGAKNNRRSVATH